MTEAKEQDTQGHDTAPGHPEPEAFGPEVEERPFDAVGEDAPFEPDVDGRHTDEAEHDDNG